MSDALPPSGFRDSIAQAELHPLIEQIIGCPIAGKRITKTTIGVYSIEVETIATTADGRAFLGDDGQTAHHVHSIRIGSGD